MTDKKQPEALRLAELLTADEWPGHMTLVSYARECAAELRRQYAELETLRASHGQAPAQPVATAGGSLARIIEEKIAAMSPSEASAFMAARAELAASGNDQAAPDMRDPYGGAREDLAIWRKRALEAEALNRKFATSVNGPTFMGEPADSDGALMAREIHESQEDSLLICASDLQHSAIYDNHVEMQSCMRAVAARIAALVHAAPKAEPAAPQPVAREPLSEAQREEIIEAVNWYNFPRDVIDAVERAHGIKGGQHGIDT